MNSSTGALLSDLVDLTNLVADDENLDAQTLLSRDHEFSQSADSTGKNIVEDIRNWIKFRFSRRSANAGGGAPYQTTETSSGEQLAAGRSLLTTALVVLGLILGWLSAAALLRYTGNQPINVLWLMLVFVFAQLALVSLFLIALIPASVANRLPVLSSITSFIESISPGRVGVAMTRLLPQRHRQSLERLIGNSRRKAHLFGGVTRWIVLCWSQVFSLAFVLGAMACTLGMIVFTNLPFGWGTTLVSGGAEGLHRLTSLMAMPWAPLLDSAVPTLELIQNTQHFQGTVTSTGNVDAGTADTARQSWWPFLIMSMAVYGLLPRLVTTLLANRRLKKEVRQSMLHQPGVSALVDRLQARAITTQAPTPETPTHEVSHHDLGVADSTLLAGKAVVINWSHVPVADETLSRHVRETLLTNVEMVRNAGGSNTIEQDNQLIEAVRSEYSDPLPTIVVVVKSWETPMLEFLDFLRDIRGAIGENSTIVVLAVASRDNEVLEAEPEHLQIWSERLQTIGDSQLRFGAPGSHTPSVSLSP